MSPYVSAEFFFIMIIVLQAAETGVFADIWKKMSGNLNNSLDATGHLKVFNESHYLYMGDRTSLQIQGFEHSKGACNWGIIPEEFFTSGFGIAVPKNSPFKASIDRM